MYFDQTTPSSRITVLPTEWDNLDQFLWPAKSTQTELLTRLLMRPTLACRSADQ